MTACGHRYKRYDGQNVELTTLRKLYCAKIVHSEAQNAVQARSERAEMGIELLGSLSMKPLRYVSQRRAQLVRVARQALSEDALTLATELLRPKAQVERLQGRNVTPAEQSELKRAIDW